MKPKLLFLFLLLLSAKSFAQQTVTVEEKLTPDVTLKYNVLSSDRKILQGLYQAFYKKKTAIASGKYESGKRAGTWHFFSKEGKVLEHFNYTTGTLTYEAPEDSTSGFKYMIDEKFTNQQDTFTKPIRIGGRYFGYLPYVNLFKLPGDYIGSNFNVYDHITATFMELLVSPAGRLADYRIHVVLDGVNERILDIKLDSLSDEDRLFAPATLNGREIASRIIIPCNVGGTGRIKF